MSNFRRKFFSVLILSVAVFNFVTNSAVASAGYLPVNFGETLNVTTCIPETGRSAKPPLILNIQGLKTNFKNVEVARVTKWGKKKGNCGKWEYEVTIPWKVKVTGSYTLVITAPNSQVDPYNVWPDGVDIPDSATNTKKSNGNTGAKSSSVNSKSYQAGQDAVLNTSQELLYRQGFFGIFGATGQPVKSKATYWCIAMQKMFPPYIEDKDATRGCVDAAMTLYRK
jgi:hypothetical protein